MDLISVNGVALPTPSKYKAYPNNIDKAERNANGNMIKERIATKIKIEMEWNYLTASEYSMLLKTTEGNFFQCKYFDPKVNEYRTITMYAGDPSGDGLKYEGGKIVGWKGVKLNLIER